MGLRLRPASLAVLLSVAAGGCGGAAPLDKVAERYQRELRRGQVVGELAFPRFHATLPVRKGFDKAMIDRGPSWFPGSYLPGEGRLVYIAAHRRTHGGPFRHLGDLRRGDRVVLTTPYAAATYAVTRLRRISERQVSILRSEPREELRLQASTIPPSHDRLIVFADLQSIRRRG